MQSDQRELTIKRFINAPPAVVWKAWSTPEHLAKWWIPAPIECQVIKLDLRPGGGFETRMRESGGDFQPHVKGCFLEIIHEEVARENLDSGDKWILCLMAALWPRTGADHDETTPPQPHASVQGKSSAGGHQG